MSGPRVLMYHDVVPEGRPEVSGFPGTAGSRYKLEEARFAEHLDRLRATSLGFGLLAADGARPPAALTFDDGGSSALHVAEELERRGWRGHFFVTTGRIGMPGFVTADEVRELARRGHDVGSHSHSHPKYMASLSDAAILEEWARSRDELQELLGRPPRTASVPGGFLSGSVIAAAERVGYGVLLTSVPSARLHRHGAMWVTGRFTILSSTSPARAVAFATGDARACGSQWAAYVIKDAIKRVSPAAFDALRRVAGVRD
ncbi:MAG: polysaccharide deacetylase family protein [Solirubrobacteraceae bacterium]|nr:polysaccharide deacetylase family protein [Solirubrobacteraceae bacterium]